MMDEISMDDILETLRANYLFHGLTDQDLLEVVHQAEVYQVERGATISKEGDRIPALYIVQSGKVCQTRQTKGREVFMKQLCNGNSWGEDCVRENSRMRFRVAAISTVLVIRIDRVHLYNLSNQIPQLAANLQIHESSRRLQYRTNNEWLRDGEEIIFMCRRHPIFLVKRLLSPALMFFLVVFSAAALFEFSTMDSSTIEIVAGVLLAFSVVWAIWNGYDWANDYSIITNMRVVKSEYVLGFYDVRHETPLESLQSINVLTTQMGRVFNYGNVIVRTYTGQIELPDVENPENVAGFIRENWELSHNRSHQDHITNIEQTLRSRLSASDEHTHPWQTGPQMASLPQTGEVTPGFLQEFFADFFKVRMETDGVLTYRKHWFVLVQTTWRPFLVSLAMLALWLIRLNDGFTFIPTSTTLGFAVLIWAAMFLWGLYAYIDWRNDRYQITQDQIIDLDKSPLGKEEKKIAQIENILSIEYKRLGIFGQILNFGTVFISVGSTLFTFDQVYNPSQVQQDLFNRMAERNYRRRQQEIQSENERVSDWIATYHNHQEEFHTGTGSTSAFSTPGEIG